MLIYTYQSSDKIRVARQLSHINREVLMNSSIDEFYQGDIVTTGEQTFYVVYWSPRIRMMDVSTEPYDGGSKIYNINVDQLPHRVTLAKRGNIFRRHHQMELMPFTDYAEEARYWRMLDMLEEVCNPADNLFYTWTLEQALEGLESGIIDAYLMSTGGPGITLDVANYGGFKVNDPTAGHQMRMKCLTALHELRTA